MPNRRDYMSTIRKGNNMSNVNGFGLGNRNSWNADDIAKIKELLK